MNWGTLSGTVTSLCRLLETSNRAARVYGIAIPTIRKPALKNLATVLLQQHALHVKQLRHHLSTYYYEREYGATIADGDAREESVWNQIDSALASGNPVLVLNGCRCVERAVTADYRAILKREGLKEGDRHLLTTQLAELLCGQESIDMFRSSPFSRFARKPTLA